MQFYEKQRNITKVYEFSPKIEEILKYKKEKINCMAKSETFYSFSSKSKNNWDKIRFHIYSNRIKENNSNLCGTIHNIDNHNEDRERKLKQQYFKNNGILLYNCNGSSYFLPNEEMKESIIFNSNVVKLPSELVSLWFFEHNYFYPSLYKDIYDLFNFELINEYDNTIYDTNSNSNNNELKFLKRIYTK